MRVSADTTAILKRTVKAQRVSSGRKTAGFVGNVSIFAVLSRKKSVRSTRLHHMSVTDARKSQGVL